MTKKVLGVYDIQDMRVFYLQDESNVVGMLLVPLELNEQIIWDKDYKLEPLIQAKIAGDDYPFGFSQGRTMRNSQTTYQMKYQQQIEEPRRIATVFYDPRGYEYIHYLSYSNQSKAIECYVTVENQNNRKITLELLTSFTLGGMTPFVDGMAEERLVLHQLRSTWSAEGRLVSTPVEELQLEPSWSCQSANSFRFGQVGSMPVREFAPFAAVEDRETGVTWAVSLKTASSWQLEPYRRDNALVLSGGLADREFGHWTKHLKQGERFETSKAVITVVKGSVDEAAQRITENMRQYLELPLIEQRLPLIFNEFCTTWGCPNQDDVEKLAGILKDKGITYFVIDAGWYDDEAFDVKVNLGEWKPEPSRFPYGMKHAARAIRECGMIPGIWFEFEVSGADNITSTWIEHLLKRDDLPITSGKRCFFDMRQKWVQDYLAEKVIGFLKENDFQYLKVDYNETIGIGCDGAESLGEGLRQQILGTQGFLKRIHEELPELVIEICSSGGHRLVASFGELGSMFSFSDAHECDEIPIIAANMHRMILPRQSQIWAVLRAAHPLKKFYYQIASTFLGRCCISGDVEMLTEEQWNVVVEGFSFYKKAWQIIDRGVTSYYGSKIKSYRKPKGYQAIMRKSEGSGKELIVLHTFHEAPDRVEIPIRKNQKISEVFKRVGIQLSIQGEQLIVTGMEECDGLGIICEEE